MKVLLNENLDPRFRSALSSHDVTTAMYAGWAGLRNGELLEAVEKAGYEIFLTGDRNLSYQQNLEQRIIAIIVLTAHQWSILQHHLSAIVEALDRATTGSFQVVRCGEFRR